MENFPLADPVILDQPFSFFATCRRESPLLFHPAWNAWFVFRHDDITALGRDARLSSQRMDLFIQGAPAHLQPDLGFLETDLRSMVVMLDSAEHHRVRSVLQQAFTPSTVAALGPVITSHADALILGLSGRNSCDISTEVCRRLPLLVLADLFSLPPEDFPHLARWAYDFIEYFNRQPVPEEYAVALVRTGDEMMEYTRKLIAQRRARPGDDLVSTLVRSQSHPGGLTDDEIIANVMMVLIAGNDTVGSALGNAIYLLLSHPEELAKVETGRVTWAEAFEETLRMEPANPVIMRKVAEDFDYRGQPFRKGQFAFLVLASGSRDEAHIAESDTFRVDRSGARHQTFGTGAHLCLGAALARAEAQALLPRIFRRLTSLRLDNSAQPDWLRTLGVRGPRTLPVLFDSASGT
jgi:cytochrome P450